jgi:1-acyl-sn-glycerol-3-phosphate acyltransferase
MNGPTLHASPFDAWMSRFVYDGCYALSAVTLTLGWSLRTVGGRHIPKTGPALLVANHQSFIDPVLVGLSTRRHLCYLARKTLFRKRAFAWFIRMLNAVPIDHHGVGKEGMKAILEQLQLGQAVVVFPEGERTHDGLMHPLRPGIQLLVRRTQAPIVPIGIAGAYDAWSRWQKFPRPAPLFWPGCRGRIAVSVGQPVDARRLAELPREESLGELFNLIAKEQRRAERLRG